MTKTPIQSFMAPVQPDEILAAIIGTNDPLPRTEITKKVWAYIKANGLQDPANRRQINADGRMRRLMDGREHVSMFELTKCIMLHIVP